MEQTDFSARADELLGALEAVLFAAGDPVSFEKLGEVLNVSESEAKRLISLGYAESLKKNTPPTNTETEEDGDKSDENGDRQPVQPDGQTGDVQK